jgi:putative membrane protein insertion efficiency factor
MKLKQFPSKAALVLIKIYRHGISPLFPPSCRYVPTCSEYAITAIERYGLLRGGRLAIKRIGRCHPFHDGGFDPVP